MPIQNRLIHLGEGTNPLSYEDTGKKLKDKFATSLSSQTALPWAWEVAKARGYTVEQWDNLYFGAAKMLNAAWTQEAPGNLTNKFLNTWVRVIVPYGKFQTNCTLQVPRCGMEGGSSFVYVGNGNSVGGDQGQPATEWNMEDSQWMDPGTERRLFETPNSGLDGASSYAYNEAFNIIQTRLVGPAKYGDGITRVGLFLRMSGECSYVNQVRCDRFQRGFVAQAGVPLTVGTITAFHNELTGFAGMGTALATINIQTLSGDKNGMLCAFIPGYGGEGGVSGNIGLLKSEDGIEPETPEAPWRGQVALYIEGQYALHVGHIAYSQNWITNDAMVIVKPQLTNGTPQNSYVNIGSTKGFNYRTALFNLTTKKRWSSPGDYSGYGFEHYAKGDKFICGDSDAVPSLTACSAPLGFIRGGGNFNYNACTPTRSGTVVVPPVPVVCQGWGEVVWGPCVNGTQTGTVAPIPAGCTGTPPNKPALTRACVPTVGDISRAGWVVKAPASTATAPVSNMLDSNNNTFYQKNGSMAVGDIISVDMGVVRTLSGAAFRCPPNYPNDFPAEYAIEVSSQNSATPTAASWKVAKAGNVGSAINICSFAAVQARHWRIRSTKVNNPTGPWYTIAEITAQGF